jgi:hypothetical protein
LLNVITITKPGNGRKFLFTDASKEGLSAVLMKKVTDNKFNILGAVSKKVSGNSDSTPELEAKAIDLGLEKFEKANLLKEAFTLCIDAKCFETFKTKRVLSGPTLRFFERISNFEIDIQWIDGTKNVLADFLSKVYSATDKPEIDFVKIKKEIEEYHVILGHTGVLQLNNFLRFFMKYDLNNQKFESKNMLALIKSVVFKM